MIPDFSAEIVYIDGQVVVAVSGEVDVATAPDLWQKMTEAIRMNPHLLLDMTSTTFMDSTGLTVLVRARRECVEQGGSVTIRSPQPAVRRVLEITKLDSLISVLD